MLHTHTLAAANALGRLAARAAGVPVVSHLHIENHFRPASRLLLATLDNTTARLARDSSRSPRTRAARTSARATRDRIEVVYNGVDLDPPLGEREPAPELGILDGDAPLVGEIGRLCDVKGQRELIDALALVPRRARSCSSARDLEQGGAYQRGLEAAAERLGVRDRVVFAGYRADATTLLGELDVVALPVVDGGPAARRARGDGRTAGPSSRRRSAGRPRSSLDGETGLLVPPRDPRARATALRRLLDDADLRRRLGEAGRRRVASSGSRRRDDARACSSSTTRSRA